MVSLAAEAASAPPAADTPLEYVQYTSEAQMPHITGLIEKDLSEPYSIFTYRYFINNWPNLCFLCMSGAECVGVIVCKADEHRGAYRGYIAMLAVDSTYRKRRIGTTLVKKAIQEMIDTGVHECVLETEETNKGALRLYEGLGFMRDKRLIRYYLNGGDAFRLKMFFNPVEEEEEEEDSKVEGKDMDAVAAMAKAAHALKSMEDTAAADNADGATTASS